MSFVCGTFFKHLCRHQFIHYKDARTPYFFHKEEESINNNLVFCSPEGLTLLSQSEVVKEEFVLVTHNSDVNFNQKNVEAVIGFFPKMKRWYTQNLLYEHEKVYPIPIGIANPKWSHGNQERFTKVASENNEKHRLFYANFNTSTNPKERDYCYQQLGLSSPVKYPDASIIDDHNKFVEDTHESYLRDISRSYFVISPDGNGKDCHKTWEALYMKSIPIVTDSYFARRFQEMGIPLIIISDWSEFNALSLSPQRYADTWKDFDPSKLTEIFL